MWCKWLEFLHIFMMQHNDSNHRKKSAFPPQVTLYQETKVQFGCGDLETVLPTGTYIPNFSFGIFSKYLVYNFLIWYIWKIWYIFGVFLSEGLVEILNQFIWVSTKRKQTNRQWCWSYIKILVILLNMGVSMQFG